MSDHNLPPVPPPYPPSGPVPPPVPTAPQAYPYATAPAPQPRAGYYAPPPPTPVTPSRGRGLVWLLVAIVAIVAVIGSCAVLSSLGSGSAGSLPTAGAIAVIPIDGEIAGTASGTSGVVTPEEFLSELKQAERDSRVRAIVLRVDSPGGTVAASEEISTYVKQAKKPVVVSIGDVGASGAYMVSSQADRIIALPGSAVGSIGVISEIPNVTGLLGKVGIQFVIIQAGKYKSAGSPYRALTATETALIQGEVDDAYGQFIDIVAEGRHMPRSQVESLATGWAWSGSQAKELKLVDQLGTYQDALRVAAKLGGIKGQDYQVLHYGRPQINSLLAALLGIQEQLGTLSAAKGTVDDATVRRMTLPK